MTWGWAFCDENGKLIGDDRVPAGKFEDEQIVTQILDKFAGQHRQCDRIWFANDRIILRNAENQNVWCFVRVDG